MRKDTTLKTVLLAVAILMSGICVSRSTGALKAGAAKVDITPRESVWLSGYSARNKPSEGVLDKLYAKALVLDDGEEKTAIVSVDLLWVPLEITSEVRKKVQAKIGIPAESILICATHTHFGPKIYRIAKDWPDTPDSEVDKAYVQSLTKRIVEAILTAGKNLKEAQIGATKGEISEIVYNRRTKKPDGTVAMTFRLPAAKAEYVFGPVDPEVGILRIEEANGSLVGAIVNYACHPVSGAKDTEKFYHISADYPGYTAKVVEEIEGGLCLFALGTAGNLNPNRIGRKDPRAEIGKALGGEVLRRIQTVSTSGDVALRGMKKEITLPRKEAAGDEKEKKSDEGEKTLTTEIQVLRIGDIYILGLPGEILVEIGLEIKKRAGIEKLFIISLSNDTCGYVCPQQAYKEGGYEPGSGTALAEGAGEIVTEQALKLLGAMKKAN